MFPYSNNPAKFGRKFLFIFFKIGYLENNGNISVKQGCIFKGGFMNCILDEILTENFQFFFLKLIT